MGAMSLEPVTALLLLGFLMILLLLLSLWFALTLWSRPAAPGSSEGTLPRASPGPPRRNDDWRGERAQAQRSARKKPEADPFETFLRGKNDELDF